MILDVLAGEDPADPDSRPYASPSFRDGLLEPPPLPPTFAFVRTPMWDKADADARSAIEDLAKELGAREVDLPEDYRPAWDALRAIMAADMASNLGGHLDKGGEASQQFRDLIAEGRKVTAPNIGRIARHTRCENISEIFEQFADAITLSAKGCARVWRRRRCLLVVDSDRPALNPLLEGLPIGALVGAWPR